jgi:CIC family chloride channel protein
LVRGSDVDVMEAVQVGEVMTPHPETLPVNMSLNTLGNEFLRTGRHGFPVLDREGKLHGVVSLSDYRSALSRWPDEIDQKSVGDIASRDLMTIFPDESVGTALRRMAPRDISRIPVVSRDDPSILVGVVRRTDIVRAYEFGALRREEARRRAATARSVSSHQARFIDVALLPGSDVVGRKIAELRLPRAAVLVSIRRGNNLVIPHGDTTLYEGDVITALCDHDCAEDVRHTLNPDESAES